jgi:hypothetical protein
VNAERNGHEVTAREGSRTGGFKGSEQADLTASLHRLHVLKSRGLELGQHVLRVASMRCDCVSDSMKPVLEKIPWNTKNVTKNSSSGKKDTYNSPSTIYGS